MGTALEWWGGELVWLTNALREMPFKDDKFSDVCDDLCALKSAAIAFQEQNSSAESPSSLRAARERIYSHPRRSTLKDFFENDQCGLEIMQALDARLLRSEKDELAERKLACAIDALEDTSMPHVERLPVPGSSVTEELVVAYGITNSLMLFDGEDLLIADVLEDSLMSARESLGMFTPGSLVEQAPSIQKWLLLMENASHWWICI